MRGYAHPAGWLGGTLLARALGLLTTQVAWPPAVAASLPQLTTAEDSVRQASEPAGGVYAGPCAATRSSEDIGKLCARFVAEQAGLHAYLVGRTFSEFSHWVFVAQTATGWQPAGMVPLDFFAPLSDIPWPPSTATA